MGARAHVQGGGTARWGTGCLCVKVVARGWWVGGVPVPSLHLKFLNICSALLRAAAAGCGSVVCVSTHVAVCARADAHEWARCCAFVCARAAESAGCYRRLN